MWDSSPLGPLTAMLPGAISTVTASGTGTGFLPSRLMSTADVGEYLATDALGAGFVAGHDANRGADDRGSGTALNPRHRLVIDVAAAARARDPLDPDDDGSAVLGVLGGHLDRLPPPCPLAVGVP